MPTFVRPFTCSKCKTKFKALVPQGAKWVQCANNNCKNMIRIKDHG